MIGWIGLIELGKGLIELGIGLIDFGIGLIELGIGLIELGIVGWAHFGHMRKKLSPSNFHVPFA